MSTLTLGSAQFGVATFFASRYPNDKCGANGLPLTPNSIKILGRFQRLKVLEHPRLCKYLYMVRAKHERLIAVTENYLNSLEKEALTDRYQDLDELKKLCFDILEGLDYLHKNGFTHRNISPGNILLDPEGRVKLANHGLFFMTGGGTDVSFPIGQAKYMAPEVICQGPHSVTEHQSSAEQAVLPPLGMKADLWSLGMVLLEVYLGINLWSTLTLQQITRKIISFTFTDTSPLQLILVDHQKERMYSAMPAYLMYFISSCLTVNPEQRPDVEDLLTHPTFNDLRKEQIPWVNGVTMLTSKLRCLDLVLPELNEETLGKDEDEDHLAKRTMEEVYYLWGLSGGNLEGALKKEGLIKTRPPITMLPGFVLEEGEPFGEVKDISSLLDTVVVPLSLNQLRQRLDKIDEAAYYPLLEEEGATTTAMNSSSGGGGTIPTSPSTSSLSETASLPTIIKERDIEYQFHRIILYKRLLMGYPHKRPQIWKEARIDVPPFCRAYVWATLLEVDGDYINKYDAIDKETPTPTDRQIEVDIPRCHQYDELLSSPRGHDKFKRILKAWVVSHPEYVYWQGLDSLSAPFLYLNFNNEALAFACLNNFIPKYLHKFFLKDNSQVIQEYLAVFSHLIAFHDPELSTHLDGIGFIPDLYSIPWFLTMYAHVFPLHKIFHLWDKLLLGNSSFPLCIGVAILLQLKEQHNLLSHGFNECILLFSDMPEIDIEKCVTDSIKVFCNTPKSSTYRQHARPLQRKSGMPSSGRPILSYYSTDYNDMPLNELSMEPIPLEELRAEKCPRISAEDLIELSELQGPAGSKSPVKKSKSGKPRIIIIDVRSPEDFQRGAIPGSINIPYVSAFSSDGELVQCPAVQQLNNYRSQVKVIVGSRGKNAAQFANEMIRLHYTKVCILHKGLDVFRNTGLLTVPSTF
ncbi:TBC domain-containing protein kinase-like protein [Lineus longissimus]|uniref:TBC domain-containing protein kinase-like protein n=1 Tax=Lineus longissimus TaxID=88925 RepID=UPI002B4D08E1